MPTLRLACSPTSSGQPRLIHVVQAFYGIPPSVNGTAASCVYRWSENHCVQLADLPPGDGRCNGRPRCLVHVSNPYLTSCRQYAVYMQINYTCVLCGFCRSHSVCRSPRCWRVRNFVSHPLQRYLRTPVGLRDAFILSDDYSFEQ